MKKVIALIFFALLAWGTFEILRELLRLYGRADANLKLAVMTAAGSAIAFVANNAIQSARERKAQLFEKKREAYDKFFQFFHSIFSRQKTGNPVSQKEIIESLQDFTKSIMTWGSADTINSFNEYQRTNQNIDPNDLPLLFGTTEKFLRALRKGLGHSDTSLEKLALTKLIVKADEHHKLE
jgi:hypothetical protein